MARYRCAVCGSPNVQKNEGNNSFSYKKALVGTAVFGTIGAVAGINGKQNVEFYCPDCNQTLKQPMNDTTRDMIDFLLSLPGTIGKNNPELLQRYTYLNKEIAQKSSVPQTTSPTTAYIPATVSDITEAEFRSAAKLWRDTFTTFSYKKDPKCAYEHLSNPESDIKDAEYLPIKTYVQALQAARTITLGLNTYGYLAVDNASHTGGDNSLWKPYLAYAVFHYTMDLYGDYLTGEDFYNYANSNPVLNRAYQAIIDTKWMNMGNDPYVAPWFNWVKKVGLFRSLNMLQNVIVNRGTNSEQKIARNYHIIDGSLYMLADKPEEQFGKEMPKESSEIEKLQAELPELEKKLKADFNRKLNRINSDYDWKINQKEKEISEKQVQIDKLRKKIFGKAKAAETADTLEKDIPHLRAEIEALRKEKDVEVQKIIDEQEPTIKETCAAQKKRLDELLELKDAFIQQAPEMICLIEGSNEEPAVSEHESSVVQQAANAVIGSYTDEIKKLKELLDVGALTQEEFDAKKKQLLGL